MAIYGRDFYGLSKYGPDVSTNYDVAPFIANPRGYAGDADGGIYVSWTSPKSNWTQIRLLKSHTGYAATEDDGEVVLDQTTSATSYTDGDVVGGTWHYYTLWIKDDNGFWNRAGITSSLAVKRPWARPVGTVANPNDLSTPGQVEWGYADLLWDRIPGYFKQIRTDYAVTDGYAVTSSREAYLYNPNVPHAEENQHLRLFTEVLGWGLDFLHNYQQTLLWSNDPKKAHQSDVEKLAEEVGIDFEQKVPTALMRTKVFNAALLARRRGTIEGLKTLARTTVGWDIDIALSPNLFLNRDQSEFTNPTYAAWDAAVRYTTGQYVLYESRVFKATATAYGSAQKPPETGTNSNSWWTVVADTDSTALVNSTTNALVTWKCFLNNSSKTAVAVKEALGISSPFDSTSQSSNALVLRDTSGALDDFVLVGASNPASDTTDIYPTPQNVVAQGIPVPRAVTWDPLVEYQLGQVVLYRGVSWQSVGVSTGQVPKDGSPYWQKVGVDDRVLLSYSFYTHGPFTGSRLSAGDDWAIEALMAFYDDKGKQLYVPSGHFSHLGGAGFYDTFNNQPDSAWSDRAPDFMASAYTSWTTVSGTWDIDVLDDRYVAYPASGTGMTLTWMAVPNTTDSNASNYNPDPEEYAYVTFTKAPAAGRTDALVMKYLDANNYLRLTRTALQQKVGGTLTTLYPLPTPLTDGDRVCVYIRDQYGYCSLYINGGPPTFSEVYFSSALVPGYGFGMMVE